MADSSKLEVAIVGGGIAGLTAAIALRQHPLINVTIYEKASELKEIGASIGLGPNGLRTLERLGLHDVISPEVGFRGPSNISMIYRHWKTDEVIGKDQHENVTEPLHHTARYYRAHLQQALLQHVPREIIHLKKKIVSAAADPEEGVTLQFEDGTIVKADLLLGADGLRSGVRSSFAPEFQLKWSGWTAFRSVFDASLTDSIPDLHPDSTLWWGLETSFFASRLGKNTYTIVGGIQSDPDDLDAPLRDVSWDQEASIKLLRDTYADWNPVVKALTEVTPNIRLFPNLSCSTSLDTWVFGSCATLIGDAAHAHGGAYTTGGSLAIEDAYTLYLSLLSVFPLTAVEKPSREAIGKALKLYEAIRKPHAERLLEKVRTQNEASAIKVRTGMTETDEELRARARQGTTTSWLHEHDVIKAFEEGLKWANGGTEGL